MTDETEPLAAAVLTSALMLTPMLVPWWFVVFVLHFGIISGPDPSVPLWISYSALGLVPAAALFAWLLRRRINRRTVRHIGRVQALVVALISLGLVHSSMGVITLYQYGHDTAVFATALVLGFVAAVALAHALSRTE